MTDTHDNTELANRVRALSFATCGVVAAAEQFTAIALQIAGGLDGLLTDLCGLPRNVTWDNREPGVLPHRHRRGSTVRARRARRATRAQGGHRRRIRRT